MFILLEFKDASDLNLAFVGLGLLVAGVVLWVISQSMREPSANNRVPNLLRLVAFLLMASPFVFGLVFYRMDRYAFSDELHDRPSLQEQE